jgi:hypothetical protein
VFSVVLSLVKRTWPVLVAAAVLVPHAAAFDFVSDDAFISFRYAKNLAEHGELVFNLGERVEGFTNFLWTILLALGIKLGVSPVLSSRFLGIVFGIGTLAVVARLSLRLDRERPSPFHLVAPLGLALMGAFACWCSGGLETQLFTFLSLLAFERFLAETESETGFASGIFFALAGMTRPEGALFFAIACLHRLVTNLWRERRFLPRWDELAWLGLFAGTFGPYFLWRWHYYGWPFPNTFYVKSSGGAGTWSSGFYYIRRFAEDYGIHFLVPIAILGWPSRAERARRSLFLFTALLWGVFVAYVVNVGGDFMGLYRFILPVIPLGAVVLQESFRRAIDRLGLLVGRPVLAVAGLALLMGYLLTSYHVSKVAIASITADGGIMDFPGYLKKYADDRVPIGIWFGQHARRDDLMSVGGAGVIPYYSGIRAFDCYGLVDETIAHDPGMTRSTRPGHQKWVSDEYLFARRPTLITHLYRLGDPAPYVPPPEEAAAWTVRGYEWVSVRIPGLSPPYYSFLKRVDRAFGPFPARPASP